MKTPSELQAQTIRYYDENARVHADRTASLDLGPTFARFLALLPQGGTVLDAGCGSGRDAKFFSERGYEVTAIDASSGYAMEALRRYGIEVSVMRFQDIEYESDFDGVWACASLLHVPRKELQGVLDRLTKALMPSGVMYVSFKEGTEEWLDGDRYFNDMTEDLFSEQVVRMPSLDIVEIWRSVGGVGKTQSWINAILQRSDL